MDRELSDAWIAFVKRASEGYVSGKPSEQGESSEQDKPTEKQASEKIVTNGRQPTSKETNMSSKKDGFNEAIKKFITEESLSLDSFDEWSVEDQSNFCDELRNVVREHVQDSPPTRVPTKRSRAMHVVRRDASIVATGVAARQLAKTVRAPLLALLVANLGADKKSAQKFLDSPEGLALVKILLGVGLTMLPLTEYSSDDGAPSNKLALVADALRHDGMTDLVDATADRATGPLMKSFGSLVTSVQKLASEPVRVAVAEEETEEEEAETRSSARARR